eukprot:sb/3477803/
MKYINSSVCNCYTKVGFFDVVTALLSCGVVFARDSPYLLSLFVKKPDITGKSIILEVQETKAFKTEVELTDDMRKSPPPLKVSCNLSPFTCVLGPKISQFFYIIA